MPRDASRPLCPSAVCAEGARLLGIVQADGRVGFIAQPLVVTREFVETAARGRAPEKRFRFAAPCVNKACRQWSGDRCGVIERVLERVAEAPDDESLPACTIRPDCRWYQQRGAAGCRVCPEIVTDTR